LLLLAGALLVRNYLSHNKKKVETKVESILRKAESSSIQGVIEESATNIANVVKRSNKIYTGAINGLARHDLEALKKNNKGVVKLSNEVEGLKNNVYYFIKNLDDSSVGGASNFYITLLGILQDFTQSLEYISKVSHKHVLNNHKKLKYNQIKELKDLDIKLDDLFNKTSKTFERRSFANIAAILNRRDSYFNLIAEKMEKQVARTRTEETSPKNTTLYFSLLTESKDMIQASLKLLELYYIEHDSSVEPARVEKEQ
ncbi:MAG: inorganic phosphate transporter, partial [Bacteroidota bacterium]